LTLQENRKNILVIGANGQLGNAFKDISSHHYPFLFIFVSREDIDLGDHDAMERFFAEYRIQFCVNCAAYTAVDRAESEPDQAFLINARAAGHIAALCKKHSIHFIHVSTDYVFDGTASSPIGENATPNPINVYGRSKLKGEEDCFKNNPGSVIIRTSWLYSKHGHNFLRTMLRLMQEKEMINVVDDQVGIPTHANDLAMAIMKIFSHEPFSTGEGRIFHFSNSGQPVSWYQFACAIREISGSHCQVNPIPASQYPTPAKRPAYSVLDTTLIMQTFDLEIPGWKESLRKTIGEIKGL
jgi:dTDP-4-dehydrorhamnose reductase